MRNLRLTFIFLLVFLSGSQYLKSQETNPVQKDSLQNNSLIPIEISDISIKASELKQNIHQEILELISDDAIRQIEAENQNLISSIDRSLFTSIDPNDSISGIHYLGNRQFEFKIAQKKIEERKIYLADVIHNIDSIKYSLIKESERWKKTKEIMLKDSTLTSIPPKLAQTISLIDSTLNIISRKSSSLLGVIDKTIETGVKINAQSDKNQALIKNKQNNAFKSDHSTLFSSGKSFDYKKELRSLLSGILREKVLLLLSYLLANYISVFFSVIIFFSFFYLFSNIKKKVNIRDSGFGYFYKNILNQLISRPVSASIILTLFFALFIFSEKPPIFREFAFYIIAFPLIHILNILFDRKYIIYTYSYGVLVVLYMMLQFLPTELFLYRIFILFIATAEIAILALFLKRFNTHSLLSGGLKRWFFYFVFLHLILAIIGFFANILGKVILSEITVFAVFFNIFNGLALIIVAMLIDGLISTGIDSEKGQQLNIFKEYGEQIKRKTIYLVNAIGITFWLLLILKNFRILQLFYNDLKNILTYKITIGSASFSVDGFLIFFAVVYGFNFISKILQIVLEKDVLSRFQFSKGLPHSVAMVVRYILLTAGFFLAVNAAGIPIDKFTIILGAMSVGIGFGLQNIFNNLVSGLILLFERPIQLGDTVQVGQLTGNVQSIGLRSSNIKTFEGAEVIVPNGQLISNEVINWTLSDQQRRIEIKVQVAYHSDPQLVYQLLNNILISHKDVLQNPESAVFFSDFGESSLNFTLLFWIGDYNEGRRIRSEILFLIFLVLKENNIEIPFPQRDLHIRTVNQEIPGISEKDEN